MTNLLLSEAEMSVLDKNIRTELLIKQFRWLKIIALVSVVVATGLAVLFSQQVPSASLLSWYVPMLVFNSAAFFLALSYQRSKLALIHLEGWRFAYRLAVFILAIGWGSMNFFLLPANPQLQFLLLLVTAIVAAGFVVDTLTDFIAVALSVCGILFPCAFWQLYESFSAPAAQMQMQTGIVFLLYALLLLIVGGIGFRLCKKLDYLNPMNSTLHEKLGKLTQFLEQRVQERTAELEYQANHDNLTNLPNQYMCEKFIEESITQAKANNAGFVVYLFALDRFKAINDSLSHKVGNTLLKVIAKRLAEHLKIKLSSESKKQMQYLIGRMWGDAFVIAIREVRYNEIENYAKYIFWIMDEPFTLDNLLLNDSEHKDVADHQFKITMSMGASFYPNNGADIKTLLMNAETAMYYAKTQGRGRFLVYKPEMNTDALEKLKLVNDLHMAIKNGEFVLHYQPVMELQTGHITGVEALIRWQHPNKGLLSPAEFILLAEEDHELISAMGEWVIRNACHQLKEWHDMGYKHLQIAINLSIKQINDSSVANIINIISEVLTETKLDPQYIEMELTENAAFNYTNRATFIMKSLRNLGLRIAIDDFGTGFSNFSYLYRFPVDILKIDRMFIADMATNQDSTVAHIIEMAHNLHLKTIAEGVETIEQLKLLWMLRCDMMQGYYFSRPVAASAFTQLLHSKQDLAPTIKKFMDEGDTQVDEAQKG